MTCVFQTQKIANTMRAILHVMVVALLGRAGHAHEGPPFPIIVDQQVERMRASIWADPDIGEARFFLILEGQEDATRSDDLTAEVEVCPKNGRLEKVVQRGKRTVVSGRPQFEFYPYFDQRDVWLTTFRIRRGERTLAELTSEVESTPPGFGPWDMVIYLIPFVLLGGMWGIAMMRRRRLTRQLPPHVAVMRSSVCRDPQYQQATLANRRNDDTMDIGADGPSVAY